MKNNDLCLTVEVLTDKAMTLCSLRATNQSFGGNLCNHLQVTGCLQQVCPKRLEMSLWSIGQNFWLQLQRSRVRFPALPDFLSSSGSGTGSTQPREVN